MLTNKKLAFTLSEVLLVVAILGVLAVLLLPNLGNNINEDKIISMFRSTLSQVNTAYSKALSEYNSVDEMQKLDCSNNAYIGTVTCFGEKLVKYLTLQTNCENSNDGTCMSLGRLTCGSGTIADPRTGTECEYSFVLDNGSGVCIISSGDSLRLYIDADGPKKGSETSGVDIFETLLDENEEGFYPYVDISRTDPSFVESYDTYRWVYEVGNLDYLKLDNAGNCPDGEALNWTTKKTCD